MAWNQPGNDKDPWGSRGGNNDNGGNKNGPPDLDEALKKLQDKLGGVFGGGNGSRGNSNRRGSGSFGGLAVVVAVVAVVLFVASGFYQVDAKERAVVLRLGAFHSIESEGLKWRIPLVDQAIVVNATTARQYQSRGLMLTQDESIVELPLTVQYNVSDVRAFALNVRDPVVSLQHATDAAVRHVVGSTELSQVLSEGREKIAKEVLSRLQAYLNTYEAGIHVMNVNIQEARPPEEVRDAFDDVIKAKEDEARFKNQAQAYANGVIPEARGRAQRMLEEAEAYRAEVIARAEGEADRFRSLVAEYKLAPQVTRERLYIDAIEEVMGRSSKVMVDVKGGNNMLYLPLDRLQGNAAQPSTSSAPATRSAPEIYNSSSTIQPSAAPTMTRGLR